MTSSTRDSWERLVAAVVKREQIWQLCHQHSRSPSISTISSQDLSQQNFGFSSNNVESLSVYPQRGASVSRVGNNGSSTPFTRKLFSAWYRIRKYRNGDSVGIPRKLDEDLIDIPENIAIHVGRGRLRRFSFDELQAATKDFSRENILPGATNVYRGWLADGSQVAVKSYRQTTLQFAEIRFQRELEINSIAAHPNVLHILGFCYTPEHRLLVFPLMDAGSVLTCLRVTQPPLNWEMRKGIALGVAKGLVHLHEECDKKILHRDIKAANILLDANFEPVVADLELGMIVEHSVTSVEDDVCGTTGHIAPEYMSTRKCSEKNDVFGYGIFLLELITGQSFFHLYRVATGDETMLLDWVKIKYLERDWEFIVDANCDGNFLEDVVERLVQIALLCTRSFPPERPKMSEVVAMLENGDGLAKKWDEWLFLYENRWFNNEVSVCATEDGNGITEDVITVDDTWIIADDTDILQNEVLSGPR